MGVFKIFEHIAVFWSRQNAKDTATPVIDQNDPEIIFNIPVPQAIAVVKETDVTTDKYSLFLAVPGRSHSC